MRDEKQPARERWPGDVDPDGPWGAAMVLRWLASDALAASAVSVDLVPLGDDWADVTKRHRYMSNAHRLMATHDLYLTLSTLLEVDQARADECADRVILGAVAGDSYGELAWEWAVAQGLDAQAIQDEARAAVARIMEET